MSDELFGKDKNRIKVFSNQLKKWGLEFTAFFRVDDIDEELVNILRYSTCVSVDLGIESATKTLDWWE
ncbi:MAG: hypothetical protein LBP77_04925 [Rickettsiales bacterium]|nr:hypothetical protein [Rickettsiales bacterium]